MAERESTMDEWVTIIGQDDRRAWREFVARAPAGDVLQTAEWGDVKRPSGWRPIHLALDDGDGLTGCALMLQRSLPWPFGSLIYCPRGPVVDTDCPEALRALLAAMRDVATAAGATLLKIDPPWPHERRDLREVLQGAGFCEVAGEDDEEGHGFGGVQPRYVMKTDLTPSEEDLLASFKQKWRYNIRLAERKGVRVETAPDRTCLPEFYRVLKATAKRDGFLVRGPSYYETLWDKLVEPGLARLFLAYAGEELIAGILCFVLGHQCWYVYGASANEQRELMPNHLLQWTAMRWAKAQGCTVYDFRGVAPETPEAEEAPLYGLNRFKKGFAAQYVEYLGEFDLPLRPTRYRAFCRLSPQLRRGWKWLRRLRG